MARARNGSIIVPQGAQGAQGPAGQGSLMAFEIEDGDLYVYYEDGETPPPFEIDSNGDLIYEL